MTTKRCRLVFTKPGSVEIQTEPLPPGQPGEVLIETEFSAISAGSEGLLYKGEMPKSLPLDSSFSHMAEPASYPLSYGYQLVGKVVEAVPPAPALIGARAFAFQPHQSHCWVPFDQIIKLPEDLAWHDAVFLPSMETAVNFAQDGQPLLGEDVVVLGLGVVGLLTTALLAQFPLSALVTADPIPFRRKISTELGATASFDPTGNTRTDSWLGDNGADLIYELSGNPAAAQLAISLSGFDSRVILGSWYGTKPVPLDLGGRFHRNRVRVKSSQVSSIDAQLRGRWSKERRFAAVLAQLKLLEPSRLITHQLPLAEAADAYQLVSDAQEDVLQILFSYKEN